MEINKLLNYMLVAIVIPVAAHAIFDPVVSKYFMNAADVEIIASAAMASQAITMMVSLIGCWSFGMKIFIKLYYPMWIAEIAMAITIAMMGSEYIALRFYLNAIQDALCVSVISQSLGYYSMKVIPRESIQTFSNKQKTVVGGAGIIGSFVAVVIGNIDIHIALWVDVFFSIFNFVFNTYVLNAFKKIDKNNTQD